MALREFDLPRDEARPRRLEITANGRVWYVDYAGGMLGVFNPSSRTFDEWVFPQGINARPYGMASDATGRIFGPLQLVFNPICSWDLNPETEEFFSETAIPSGGGVVRHMHYHKASGAVWFGSDTNYIGRAIVEPVGETTTP